MLLASGGAARAQTPDTTTANTFEGSALGYGEAQRVYVFEPSAKITHLFTNAQSLSALAILDVITGASPTGAAASNQTQTTTSASGGSSTTTSSQLPAHTFNDMRGALDLGWGSPLGRYLRSDFGTHASLERDYSSLGVSERLSIDLFQRLATVSVGGSYNQDGVFPKGGTPLGMSPTRIIVSNDPQDKRVTNGTVGISRILTRRWMMSVDGSRTVERGYLTEPYKIVSIVTPDSGNAVGQVTEKRPDTRDRRSVMASSVYSMVENTLYLSYRYYWDDWGVRSHTLDARYRIEMQNRSFLQPHLRLYTQSAADFFTFGLTQGAPLPAYASADQRLGPLRSATLGLTYGLRVPDHPGEFTIRAEWIHQWGEGSRTVVTSGGEEEGPSLQQVDLLPALDIATLTFGYTVGF
jgi:hypothetical protein